MSKSKDYHDYVIKNGDFVGKFEEMYQNSSDTPWHPDATANAIFTDIAMVKSVLWYVLEKLDFFWTNLEHMARKFVYICQLFPEKKIFYGSDISLDACVLEQYVGKWFDIQYFYIEINVHYGNRELIQILAKKR